MFFNPEIKTVQINLKDYCRDYRDPEKFIAFCRECPNYQHLWCCPEFSYSTDEVIKPYNYATIIGFRMAVDEHLCSLVRGSEAVGDMSETITRNCRRYTDSIMLGLEKAVPGSLSFHAGRCYRCAYCNKLFGKPCVHPDEMRPSLEAYGFDVAKTATGLLGYELEWGNDSMAGHFFLISALFTKDRL